MREAIDYNALSWVRKELGETLRQARLQLEEYAGGGHRKELLQTAAAQLHEARGPLHMVNLKGADMLACEMEEAIADLLLESAAEPGSVLELLMQGFLELPEYLSSLRSGRQDSPAVLFPLINSLRGVRGLQPLQAAAIYTPNLSARVPRSVFDMHAQPVDHDMATLARAARLRFQSGLLEWYRGGRESGGPQALMEVLDHLQQHARSEPAARVWWVGAGLAELLRDGELEESAELKRLFGQLDRSIKRLMDRGETVFSDPLTDELLKHMLFQITSADGGSERVVQIRATYGIEPVAEPDAGEQPGGRLSDEVLQSFSGSAREDIERIKQQVDSYLQEQDPAVLESLAEEMHAVANRLDMVGMQALGQVVTGREQELRELAAGTRSDGKDVLTELANTLVVVEDALTDLGSQSGAAVPDAVSDASYHQGRRAVIEAVIGDLASAKESISEFLKSSGSFELLDNVPEVLHRIHGGLELLGEERLAEAGARISEFVASELLAGQRTLAEDELDSLADAICSIEFCVEQLGENQYYGDHAIQVAEQSLASLGYPASATEPDDSAAVEAAAAAAEPETAAAEPQATATGAVSESDGAETLDGITGTHEPVVEDAAGMQPEVADDAGAAATVSSQQVLAADADPEIVEIFLEEAADMLGQLDEQVPAWCANPVDAGLLGEVRRAFHTLKGSGRMIGALAAGEFAWAFESLLNCVIDNSVTASESVLELVGQAPAAMRQLVAAVGAPDSALTIDVDALADAAMRASRGEPVTPPGRTTDVPEVMPELQDSAPAEAVDETPVSAPAHDDESLPALAEHADAEIVEIFLEEAAQEQAVIETGLQRWLHEQDAGLLEELRRAFHTMKGSGRMAGAMLTGEFCWSIETLLTNLQETGAAPGPLTCELLSAVPPTLAALLAQVQGGGVPQQDIADMMRRAAALIDGSLVDVPSQATVAESSPDESGQAEVREPDSAEEEDQTLMELFTREAGEHLATLSACMAEQGEDHHVSEALYRSLHTLSGICESAQVPGIGRIAGALYDYFAGLYHDGRPAVSAAFAVLDDSVHEMLAQHASLPAQLCDEAVGTALLERIAALPAGDDAAFEAEPGVAGWDGQDDLAAVEWQEPAAQSVQPDTGASLPAEHVQAATAAGEQSDGAAGDVYATMDPELYEVFVEEAAEIMDAGEGVLRDWSAQPDDRRLMAEYQRHLHTLKGGARMVDFTAIGDLGHRVESLLAGVGEGEVAVSDELFALLNEAHDRLAEMLELVKARRPLGAAAGLEARLDALLHRATQAPVEPAEEVTSGGGAALPGAGEDDVSTARSVPGPEQAEASGTLPAADEIGPVDQPDVPVTRVLPVARMPERVERRQAGRPRSEQVRVHSDVLDNLVNNAGEISIYRTRMEQQVSNYRFNLSELDQTITRLHEQLRLLEIETEAQILYRFEQDADSRLEFDPLELDRYSTLQQLSRSLIESIGDLRSLQVIMEHTTRDAETLLLQQSRVSTDLQESLIRTRMIPFANLAPRLRRIVRQSARELGKRVELQMQGADGEMDRAVIERIIAPLEHMLRNAIAHGIETPEQRREAGKDGTGAIRIEFDREGPEIVLRITDDGAGLNVEAIRARAIERGLLAQDAALPDAEIMQFILQSGFSTADEVTQIAGRGVGMDVVSSEVKQLGGSLELDSVPGAGATFTVRLPYTLAINQALLVDAGDETFCVPIGSIEGVVRLYPEELRACYQSEDRIFEYAGNRYHLKHLASLLASGSLDTTQLAGQVPVLLLRVGDKRVGLQVEALLGSREIVIKPLGQQLSMVDGISGATVLGDGRVVMILDMASVARMQPQQRQAPVTRQEIRDGRLAIMVVDDSITVRKVTTRLLERNGYRVMTAKDGVDAMGQLADNIPDMMLLDIEMPRMDGFELATHMRNDESLRHVPIIMITSRTGDKHRQRAEQIGVNEFLGKPYQENELLDAIHAILGMKSASSGH